MSGLSATRPTIQEALTRAISEALSEMTFLDSAVATGELPFPTSHVITVSFSRPIHGHIALHLSLEVKKAIAENVHGRDWGALSAAEIDDCLLELGNVVAGNYLTAYCGKETAHDISLPALLFDDADLTCPGERVEVCYDVEGNPLRAVICLG
jgi:CheY-specific phosphatase CheX